MSENPHRPSPLLRLRLLACLAGLVLAAGACSLAGRPAQQETFKVTIENVTDRTEVTTLISTGVAFTHSEDFRLFEAGRPVGKGLEGIAEDGQKWTLNGIVADIPHVYDHTIFDTPPGSTEPANIGGGQRYEFHIAATPERPWLSLATMVGFTNDLYLALDTGGRSGYRLFHPDGTPKSNAELAGAAAHWDVWDAGTEINEPNGMGEYQPDASGGMDIGPPDQGLVQVYEDTAHPIDPAGEAFAVEVRPAADGPEGRYRVTLHNRTDRPGLQPSALSPVLAVAHGPTFSLFDLGTYDRPQGLEALAEDGDPGPLAGTVAAHPDVAGHVVTRGPLPPGEAASFTVELDAAHPRLSLAAMYVESNDVFLSFLNPLGQSGLSVHGRDGEAATAAAADALRFLDAGTEANQVIGRGPDQAPRQDAPGQGEPEPGTARRYRKPTDPLQAADVAVISIERAPGVTRKVSAPAPPPSRAGDSQF